MSYLPHKVLIIHIDFIFRECIFFKYVIFSILSFEFRLDITLAIVVKAERRLLKWQYVELFRMASDSFFHCPFLIFSFLLKVANTKLLSLKYFQSVFVRSFSSLSMVIRWSKQLCFCRRTQLQCDLLLGCFVR